MTRKKIELLGSAVLFLIVWLAIGFEEQSIDHESRYVAFVKKQPSLKFIFHDYFSCDECDATSYKDLSEEMQIEFHALCRIKYGIFDPTECDAMYQNQHKIRASRMNGF